MADSASQPRILVVDDDPIIRLMLATRLRAAGYVVEMAEDGEGGLQTARRSRPDLILTDWMMPRLDGLALIKAVRADPVLQHAYIIVLTSRENPTDQCAALTLGADDYLMKPWSEERLLARVRSGARIRRIQQEVTEDERQSDFPPMGTARADELVGPRTAFSAALCQANHCGTRRAE
jgi:DNA-binding response OmpR family regulator